MSSEIINRVANSTLITFDLEDYYPVGERFLFDIKDWLHEGLVLREKDFRKKTSEYDWSVHQDQFVALTCSTDAIIPAWAFMLLGTYLQPHAGKVVSGDLLTLESTLYTEIIQNLDVSHLQNKSVIIKGCTNKPVPANAYILLIAKLQPIVKSLMYGEACSSVPLYKKAKL